MTEGRYGLPILHRYFSQIGYDDFDAALGQMIAASEDHSMCRIIGHPGSGKTTLLLEHHRHDPNSIYVAPTHDCRTKDLLIMMAARLDFDPGKGTTNQCIQNFIAFLNHRGRNTTFLIDEADHLCPPGGHLDQIDKLDTLRYIWDFTRMHTAFIFAAPYELEARLQHSGSQISNSQFYRRCMIHPMTGMPDAASRQFLKQTEQEFHVHFDPSAELLLRKRISAIERGGLGVTIAILKSCFAAVLPHWHDFKLMIENDIARAEALSVFEGQETVTITGRIVEDAMALLR